MHIYIIGLTTPSSTFSSDMSTAVSESSSTYSSDTPTTVSKAPLPPITTSRGLPQEILIAIVISSLLAAGLLILLVLLVLRQCRHKTRGTPAKKKENHYANKQNNLTKKDNLRSNKPREFKLSEKRNTKLESTSLAKKRVVPLENFACNDRVYQHYPQTTDYWNNYGNQHVFNNSYTEENMVPYGNQQDKYLRPHSRPNNRMLYQSHYPEFSGHNEELFGYYRVDNLCTGQQMYQRPYVALYDKHIINSKQDDKKSFKGRLYEKNWDLLY